MSQIRSVIEYLIPIYDIFVFVLRSFTLKKLGLGYGV